VIRPTPSAGCGFGLVFTQITQIDADEGFLSPVSPAPSAVEFEVGMFTTERESQDAHSIEFFSNYAN
jgi:hypothetical protein